MWQVIPQRIANIKPWVIATVSFEPFGGIRSKIPGHNKTKRKKQQNPIQQKKFLLVD